MSGGGGNRTLGPMSAERHGWPRYYVLSEVALLVSVLPMPMPAAKTTQRPQNNAQGRDRMSEP